ncbi:MAG: hypothetical protein FJX30_01230 [Alphaproteobacteria bacterium]|nr:hypothetical protein [Alphaproteobacteria bacterium]
MQLKTIISRSDISKYYKNAQHRLDFKHQNPIEDIYEKIQKNYHIALIFDESGNDIIGAIVCKIDNDFFSKKLCSIIDFYALDGISYLTIANLLIDWIMQISQQYLCQKIVFESFTKNKEEQKFFSSKKFILEKFMFVKEI